MGPHPLWTSAQEASPKHLPAPASANAMGSLQQDARVSQGLLLLFILASDVLSWIWSPIAYPNVLRPIPHTDVGWRYTQIGVLWETLTLARRRP